MPDRTVAAALGDSSGRLLEAAKGNRDLCNAFVAMLWIVANRAAELGARMDGVRCGEVTMTDNRIKFHVSFHGLALPGNRHIDVQARDMAEHIGKEQAELDIFIRANDTIPSVLMGVVEKIDAYARDKGKRFGEIVFASGFMSEDDDLVLELMR